MDTKKAIILFSLVFLIFSSCISIKKSVERSKPNSDKINWPEAYKPEKSGFFVHNEIEIEANPEIIWSILIEAESWPNWYKGMTGVKIQTNSTGKLDEKTLFSFKTMGQFFDTVTIREFKAPYRLSWEATRKDIQGYHAWLIIPTDIGCKVITSEAQNGFKAFLQKVFLPNKLRKLHDVWLTELKKKSEKIQKSQKS